MENITEDRSLHPGVSILIFFATIFLGFFLIGPLIGFFLALPFYDGGFFALVEELGSGQTSEAIRVPYMIMQGSATAIGLVAIPMLAYRYTVKMRLSKLIAGSSPMLVFGLTAAGVIAFMFPNSVVIEWNANLNFSGFFWSWAKEMEAKGEILTKFLVNFQSHGAFLVGLIVIAVLPAIGEEFTFRGWLQPAIQKLTGNAHVAIWASAFLFSAFHFQFFGFVPRMLLGGIFGYLMYWSNNLWLPIVAHFVNNGFSVVMLYLHQLKLVEFDAFSTEALSTEALPLTYVIPFAILFLLLMVFIKKLIHEGEKTAQPVQ